MFETLNMTKWLSAAVGADGDLLRSHRFEMIFPLDLHFSLARQHTLRTLSRTGRGWIIPNEMQMLDLENRLTLRTKHLMQIMSTCLLRIKLLSGSFNSSCDSRHSIIKSAH